MALIWSPGALDDVQELVQFLDGATGDLTTGDILVIRVWHSREDRDPR